MWNIFATATIIDSNIQTLLVVVFALAHLESWTFWKTLKYLRERTSVIQWQLLAINVSHRFGKHNKVIVLMAELANWLSGWIPFIQHEIPLQLHLCISTASKIPIMRTKRQFSLSKNKKTKDKIDGNFLFCFCMKLKKFIFLAWWIYLEEPWLSVLEDDVNDIFHDQLLRYFVLTEGCVSHVKRLQIVLLEIFWILHYWNFNQGLFCAF